tara:strand:+ start:1478 stop:1678 length:201 start_codon:yes stop_codon:yes gene_type:complete
MKASKMNVSYYTTAESIVKAMDLIENDSVNYHGNWLRGGPDIQLKEGAKNKLVALHKRLDNIDLGE